MGGTASPTLLVLLDEGWTRCSSAQPSKSKIRVGDSSVADLACACRQSPWSAHCETSSMKAQRTLPPTAAPIEWRDLLQGLVGLVRPSAALDTLNADFRRHFGVKH